MQYHPDVVWQRAHIVTHEETGISVIVSVLPLRDPRYSIGIGRVSREERQDGLAIDYMRLLQFFHIMKDRDTGYMNLDFECPYIDIINNLVNEALEWIKGKMKEDIIARDQAREEKKAGNGNGKTAKKKAKIAAARDAQREREKTK